MYKMKLDLFVSSLLLLIPTTPAHGVKQTEICKSQYLSDNEVMIHKEQSVGTMNKDCTCRFRGDGRYGIILDFSFGPTSMTCDEQLSFYLLDTGRVFKCSRQFTPNSATDELIFTSTGRNARNQWNSVNYKWSENRGRASTGTVRILIYSLDNTAVHVNCNDGADPVAEVTTNPAFLSSALPSTSQGMTGNGTRGAADSKGLVGTLGINMLIIAIAVPLAAVGIAVIMVLAVLVYKRRSANAKQDSRGPDNDEAVYAEMGDLDPAADPTNRYVEHYVSPPTGTGEPEGIHTELQTHEYAVPQKTNKKKAAVKSADGNTEGHKSYKSFNKTYDSENAHYYSNGDIRPKSPTHIYANSNSKTGLTGNRDSNGIMVENELYCPFYE